MNNLRVTNNIRNIFNVFSIIVVLGVIVISFTRTSIPWDSWAYHFPFSAQIFEINNYSNTFLLDKSLQIRYDGFPLLPEFLQGLLWIATNSLSATALINSVSLVFFIIVAVKYGRANFPILVFGALSFPLIAVHALTSYIDLFVGVWLAFQYLVAVIIYRHFSGAKVSSRLVFWYALFICASFVSGNSKMWAPVISFAITAFLLFAILNIRREGLNKNIWGRFFTVLILSSILSFSTFIKNSFIYGNPIYPIQYSIPALNVHLPGPEIEYKNYPGYADRFGIFQRPIYFALSISEYDWIIRGVDPFYKIETGMGDNPKKYSPARTGGWWGLGVVISLSIIFGMLIIRKLPKFKARELDLFPLSLFGAITLLTAFMPQSHELRYFLYWPLMLIFNVAYLTNNLIYSRIKLNLIVAIYCGFFLYSTFVLRGETLEALMAYRTQADLIGISPNADEIITAKKLGGICLGPEYSPNQFKYSSVFQGGNYVIEQGWLGCKHYPSYHRP